MAIHFSTGKVQRCVSVEKCTHAHFCIGRGETVACVRARANKHPTRAASTPHSFMHTSGGRNLVEVVEIWVEVGFEKQRLLVFSQRYDLWPSRGDHPWVAAF